MNFIEAMKSLTLKFTSGNHISVERATIIDKEWEAIKTEITRLEKIECLAKRLTLHIKVLFVMNIITLVLVLVLI